MNTKEEAFASEKWFLIAKSLVWLVLEGLRKFSPTKSIKENQVNKMITSLIFVTENVVVLLFLKGS